MLRRVYIGALLAVMSYAICQLISYTRGRLLVGFVRYGGVSAGKCA